MVIYKTKSQQNRYVCSVCCSNFSQQDLEFDCKHPSVEKYCVKPDATHCPFCGFQLEFENASEVVRTIPKRDLRKKIIYPAHLPRTVGQNCLSGNHTIKDQIYWTFWEKFAYINGVPFSYNPKLRYGVSM